MCNSPFIVRLYETYNGQQSRRLSMIKGVLWKPFHKQQPMECDGAINGRVYKIGQAATFDGRTRNRQAQGKKRAELSSAESLQADICLGKTSSEFRVDRDMDMRWSSWQ